MVEKAIIKITCDLCGIENEFSSPVEVKRDICVLGYEHVYVEHSFYDRHVCLKCCERIQSWKDSRPAVQSK